MNRIKRHWREAFVGLAVVAVMCGVVDVARVLWWVIRTTTESAGADG